MVLANSDAAPSGGFQKRGIGLESTFAAGRNQSVLKQFQLVAHRDLAGLTNDEQLSSGMVVLTNARPPQQSALEGLNAIKPLIYLFRDMRMIYAETLRWMSSMVVPK
jgi:hypothetical protein